MAKISGPIASAMRGKVGQVVAAKTVGGDTALRAYQPVVKNPNTLRQQVSREKMRMASALAALLREPIYIGYAKAVQGMKMYARNLFMSGVIPQNKGYFTVTDGVVARSTKDLPLSKAAGIAALPEAQVGTDGEGNPELTFVNAANVKAGLTGNLGVIVALYSETSDRVFVYKDAMPASGAFKVSIPQDDLGVLESAKCAIFYKEIPVAVNGVATDTIPWKYPSATSDTAYVTL